MFLNNNLQAKRRQNSNFWKKTTFKQDIAKLFRNKGEIKTFQKNKNSRRSSPLDHYKIQLRKFHVQKQTITTILKIYKSLEEIHRREKNQTLSEQ